MCCFAHAIQSVADTLIFGRLTDQRSQVIAYQMHYRSEVPNAMILPLPVQTPATEGSIRFINLEEYGGLFEDLASAFPYIPSRGIACALLPTDDAKGQLAVHQVGNYIASFAPHVDDLARLHPRFSISKETWLKIPAYTDYGFAVFQLQKLEAKTHPMAFEFKTRSDKIFFPTVHIHDGEVHAHEDFDHTLFMQHAGMDSIVGSYVNRDIADASTGLIRSVDVAHEFVDIERAQGLVAPDLMIHRTRLHGKLENKDMRYFAEGSPLVPYFNVRKLLRYWPLALLVAGVGWFFNRRSRIRHELQTASTHSGSQHSSPSE